MAYEDYKRVDVEIINRVLYATVCAPPLNVMSLELFRELRRLGKELEDDCDVRVLVLRSADPEFFIAHFDVEAILEFSIDGEPQRGARNVFHEMCECFSKMGVVTIAQIEGRVGGGGCELICAFDMRFGVRGKTLVNQMEVPLGILPGGGGTQRLPRLVGRGRALEIILGAEDLDAETAEHWGLLNRVFEAEDIGSYVDDLAARIASHPQEAVRCAKAAVDAFEEPLAEGLVEEDYLFQRLLRTDEAQERMRAFLRLGGQTRDGERKVASLFSSAAKKT